MIQEYRTGRDYFFIAEYTRDPQGKAPEALLWVLSTCVTPYATKKSIIVSKNEWDSLNNF